RVLQPSGHRTPWVALDSDRDAGPFVNATTFEGRYESFCWPCADRVSGVSVYVTEPKGRHRYPPIRNLPYSPISTLQGRGTVLPLRSSRANVLPVVCSGSAHVRCVSLWVWAPIIGERVGKGPSV